MARATAESETAGVSEADSMARTSAESDTAGASSCRADSMARATAESDTAGVSEADSMARATAESDTAGASDAAPAALAALATAPSLTTGRSASGIETAMILADALSATAGASDGCGPGRNDASACARSDGRAASPVMAPAPTTAESRGTIPASAAAIDRFIAYASDARGASRGALWTAGTAASRTAGVSGRGASR